MLILCAGCDMGGGLVRGGNPDNPVLHTLPPTQFSTKATPGAGYVGWSTINDAIKTAGKYVILDLSACTAEGNVIEGFRPPSGNLMNIIGHNRFIKGIILPATLTAIGDYAFHQCTNLTSITLPNSLTSIGFGAFAWCDSLTSITLPNSLTSIAIYAFERCSSLTTVTFQGPSIASFSGNAFPEGANNYSGSTLKAAYEIDAAGTYVRSPNGSDWRKL